MKERNFPKFLKIASLSEYKEIKPFVFPVNENKTLYLADSQVIKLLSEVLGFEFEILEPADGEYGTELSDHSWTGMVGMVHRGEADIAIGRLSLSYKRSLAVHFSYPYHYSPTTFITDNPEPSPDSYAMIRPFSQSVWVAVAISLIIMLLVSTAFRSKKDTFVDMFLNVYGSFLGNSISFHSRKFSIKLFIFSWIVGAFFITESYKAVLLSFLTFPTLSGIKDIEQLAKASRSKSFKCSTYEGGNIHPYFLESDEKNWQEIGKCLSQTDMFTNDIIGFLHLKRYRKAYVGTKHDLESYRESYFISEDSFFIDFCNFATQLDFCCKELLDEAIHRISAVGLFLKYERDEHFFSALKEGKNENEVETLIRKLSLKDFSAAFICLIGGHTLSLIVFALETYVGKKQRNAKHVSKKRKSLKP